MKKLLLAFALSSSLVSASFADTNLFFEQMIGTNLTDKGSWAIIGRKGDEKKNAGCAMTTSWNDGSYIWFVKDLIDGEFYIEFRNNAWNISDAPGNYEFRMNFKYSNGSIRGGDLTFYLLNKNTVFVRNLEKGIVEHLYNAKELAFVMPGSIKNAVVFLDRTREALNLMSRCIDESKNYKLEGAQSQSRPGIQRNI